MTLSTKDIVGKVDVFTQSRNLEDLILSGYPGRIFEGQHHIDDSDPDSKIYSFLNIDKGIIDYLKYKDPELNLDDDYEVRSSDGGGFVMVRRNGKIVEDEEELERYLIK